MAVNICDVERKNVFRQIKSVLFVYELGVYVIDTIIIWTLMHVSHGPTSPISIMKPETTVSC